MDHLDLLGLLSLVVALYSLDVLVEALSSILLEVHRLVVHVSVDHLALQVLQVHQDHQVPAYFLRFKLVAQA